MSSPSTSAADIVSNLANFLPTGTYLTFQALAPIFTNNGNCGASEKIMTGLLLLTFSTICIVLCFTDSVSTDNGKVLYGIVTCKGLYNPQLATSGLPYRNSSSGCFYVGPPGNKEYHVGCTDLLNASLNVIIFCVLTIFTAPLTTCYYPNIPSTIVKTIPILVALIVGMYFAFAPPPRRGIGFATTATGTQLVSEHPADSHTANGVQPKDTTAHDDNASLLNAGAKDSSSIGNEAV